MTTDEQELIADVLRDTANGVAPERPSRAYATVAFALAEKLSDLNELARAHLLRPHATDPNQVAYFDHLAACAGWDLLPEARA